MRIAMNEVVRKTIFTMTNEMVKAMLERHKDTSMNIVQYLLNGEDVYEYDYEQFYDETHAAIVENGLGGICDFVDVSDLIFNAICKISEININNSEWVGE